MIEVLLIPEENHQRGTICTWSQFEPTRIKKGETFLMTAVGSEGGCRFQVKKKEYAASSCYWLEGFTRRETDIYHPVRAGKP